MIALRNSIAMSVLALLLLTMSVGLTGCGGGEDETTAQPTVDPRFASAEAILEYYNSLATATPTVNPDELFELFYAENDIQRGLVDLIQQTIPLLMLDQAMFEQFGETLSQGRTDVAPLAPVRKAAELTDNDGARMRATEISSDGDEEIIQFVKIGDRWWLSGYTLEHDPDFADATEQLDFVREMMGYLAEVATEITPRVRSGELRTSQQVGIALGLAIRQRHPELTNDPEKLRRIFGGG